MRGSLTINQLGLVVHMYSRNIQDATLPVTIQTTSVRLLLNLVDNIFRNKDNAAVMSQSTVGLNSGNNNTTTMGGNNGGSGAKGKLLLLRILKTLVNKFDTIQDHLLLVEDTEQRRLDEQEYSELGTRIQLNEMIKTRSLISNEANQSQQLLGSLNHELDKNYYSIVGIDAHCEEGNFFFNGSTEAPTEPIAPKGGYLFE